MSSELLGGAVDVLKGNLSGAWDIKHGYADAYTDLGIAKKFGGAAAAYSLRDIGAMNGRVVKVRRDADNEERDFSAQSLKAAADWCNGLQEFTLPCDVATAAAGYSLRKVKADYSGDAVRIRRESDDVEVNVAYDSNDEVSTSSAITNVTESPDAGDTTATTLGAFLTESVNTYNSDYSAGVDGWTTTGSGTLAGNIDGIGGRDDNLRFTSAVADISVNHYHRRNNVLELGQTYNVTFDFYIPSSNARLDQIKEIVIGGQTFDLSSLTALDQWVSASATSTTGATTNNIIIRWEDSSESGDATGDVSYIRNVSINAVGHNATVQTWYDQAGSLDATQDTAASQPKIAEAGSLVTKSGKTSIDFTVDSTVLVNLDFSITETESAVFAVWQPAADGASATFARSRALFSNNGGGIFIATPNSNNQIGFKRFGTVQNFALDISNLNTINAHAFVGTSSGANYYFNGSSIYSDSLTGSNATRNDLYIGTKENVTTHDTQGYISEFIFYDSDQSSNFFKIQSNINNHYGLYTAAEDGFVNTWYDQSGNSNNATAPADTNEPKIVSAGSLLADGIDFDGSDDYLQCTSALGITTDTSAFTVVKLDTTAGAQFIVGNRDGAGDGSIMYNSSGNFIHLFQSGNAQVSSSTNESLVIFEKSATEILVAVNDGTPTTTANTDSIDVTTAPRIGTRSFSSPSSVLDGSIKEIVIYSSVQTANRSDIIDNINNHYSIF